MRNVPFAVGQVWKDRSGSLWEIISLASPGNWFYFTAAHCSSDAKARFNANGYYFNDGNTSSNDLIECVSHNVTPSIKKLLNFWEARQAAKAGKKVKIVGQEVGKDGGLNWEMWQFVNGWSERELDAQWEIVEETKQQTYYLNVYKSGVSSSYITIAEANRHNNVGNTGDRLYIMAVTVDENGKLISARNV